MTTNIFSVKRIYCYDHVISFFIGRNSELEGWRKATDAIFLAQERLQNIYRTKMTNKDVNYLQLINKHEQIQYC